MANRPASEEPSVDNINRLRDPEGRSLRHRFTPSNVIKAILLVVLICILIWIVVFNIESALLKAKRLFKYKAEGDTPEISGLDE
jgi:hypothetical protein